MARDGVAVEAMLAAAIAAKAAGRQVNVAAVAAEHGVSRSMFYRYLDRFSANGVDGFFPRSRRPHTSPNETGAAVCEQIVRARKELADDRVDAGAISILGWLADHDVTPLPSRATVHRVLVRHGLVVAQPAKRPRRLAWRRFEATAPNQLWQFDGFETALADGTICVVLQIIDDHSRLDLCCQVAPSENSHDVWAAFTTAADRYRLPARVLTDNGTAFSGRRRGWSSPLETNLRALGIQPISSTPKHPQTCGKAERAHGTTEKWLSRRPPAETPAQLQALLETYRGWYNTDRRHQGIGGLTPSQRWTLTAPADRGRPADHPVPEPLAITNPPVSASGCIGVDTTKIGLGRRHAGHQATVFRTGDDVTVFIDTQMVRQLRLDRTRHYQRRTPPAP